MNSQNKTVLLVWWPQWSNMRKQLLELQAKNIYI